MVTQKESLDLRGELNRKDYGSLDIAHRVMDMVNKADELECEIRHDTSQLVRLCQMVNEIIETNLGHKVCKIIEIGSYCGGTGLAFNSLFDPTRTCSFLSIDLCDRKHATAPLYRALDYMRTSGIYVEQFVGNSVDPRAQIIATKFGMCQFLYIDGCHKTNHVVHDYLAFRKYVVDGGVIGFHDVGRTKLVKRAWGRLTNVFDKQGIIYKTIGIDEWDRKLRPWATGIGIVQWDSTKVDIEVEQLLWEMYLNVVTPYFTV